MAVKLCVSPPMLVRYITRLPNVLVKKEGSFVLYSS